MSGRLLEPSGLSALLEVVVTSFDVGVAKPDPTLIRGRWNGWASATSARVLYVGNADDR